MGGIGLRARVFRRQHIPRVQVPASRSITGANASVNPAGPDQYLSGAGAERVGGAGAATGGLSAPSRAQQQFDPEQEVQGDG